MLKGQSDIIKSFHDALTNEEQATQKVASFVTDFIAQAQSANPEWIGKKIAAKAPIRCGVLEGGGAKGSAHLGAVSGLTDYGALDQLEYVAGSSAGAINAFLISMGLDAKQIETITQSMNFMDLLDPIETGTTVTNLLAKGHLFSGENALNFFETLVEQVLGDPHATFADLEKARQTNPSLKSLFVTGTRVHSDSAKRDNVVFSAEGDMKDVRIADAVRASMSIPPAYKPCNVRKKDGTSIGLFYDGGILNNLPLDIFDKPQFVADGYQLKHFVHKKSKVDVPSNPSSLGFKLVSRLDKLNKEITPFSKRIKALRTKNGLKESVTKKVTAEDLQENSTSYHLGKVIAAGYVKGMFKWLTAPTKLDVEDMQFKYDTHADNIVQMYVEGVDTMEFSVAGEKYHNIVKSGRTAVHSWWDKSRDPKLVETDLEVIDSKNPVNVANLHKYLEEFTLELNKYELGCEGYDKNEIHKNVRLYQLAQHIDDCLNVLKLEKVAAEIEKAKESLLKKEQAKLEHKQNLEKFLGSDNKVTLMLQLTKKEGEKNTAQFMRLFKSEMSNTLEIINASMPQGSLGAQVIKAGRADLLKEMLAYVKKMSDQVQYIVLKQQDANLYYGLNKKGKRFAQVGDIVNSLLLDAIDSALLTDPECQSLKLLLENGASPFAQLENGLTAFQYAVNSNNVRALATFENYCKDKKIAIEKHLYAPVNQTNADNFASEFAKQLQADPMAAKATLDAMLKETLTDKSKLKLEALFKEQVSNSDSGDNGLNILCLAAKYGNVAILNTLLQFNYKYSLAMLDVKCQQKTPLYFAAENGHVECVQALRNYDAEVDNAGPSQCKSALLIAAKNSHLKAASSILHSKPSVFGKLLVSYNSISRRVTDSSGKEVLHYLAQVPQSADLFQEILWSFWSAAKGVSATVGFYDTTKVSDNNGKTPLHHIIDHDRLDILQKLITQGKGITYNYYMDHFFDLESVGVKGGAAEGLDPVHYALSLDKLDIAKFICANCSDKTLKDKFSRMIAEYEQSKKPDEWVMLGEGAPKTLTFVYEPRRSLRLLAKEISTILPVEDEKAKSILAY